MFIGPGLYSTARWSLELAIPFDSIRFQEPFVRKQMGNQWKETAKSDWFVQAGWTGRHCKMIRTLGTVRRHWRLCGHGNTGSTVYCTRTCRNWPAFEVFQRQKSEHRNIIWLSLVKVCQNMSKHVAMTKSNQSSYLQNSKAMLWMHPVCQLSSFSMLAIKNIRTPWKMIGRWRTFIQQGPVFLQHFSWRHTHTHTSGSIQVIQIWQKNQGLKLLIVPWRSHWTCHKDHAMRRTKDGTLAFIAFSPKLCGIEQFKKVAVIYEAVMGKLNGCDVLWCDVIR